MDSDKHTHNKQRPLDVTAAKGSKQNRVVGVYIT